MCPNALAQYLSFKLDSTKPCNYWCPITAELNKYKETKLILEASGHDTHDLQKAIELFSVATQHLKAVQEASIAKFKKEGVCFIVDHQKAAELESACLQ
jgi:hypothetical protein